jgi:hypothetical protein
MDDSGGETKLENILKNAPEISAWGEAHGSILRYEGEPASSKISRIVAAAGASGAPRFRHDRG